MFWVPEWPPSDERGDPESVRLSSGAQPPRPGHRHGTRHAPAPAANDGSAPGLHGDARPCSTGHGHGVSGPAPGPAQPRFPGQLPTCTGNTISPSPSPRQPPSLLSLLIGHLRAIDLHSFQQAAKTDDDDFQDFQEAPKSGGGDTSFADFKGESDSSFPAAGATQHPNR